MKSNKKTTINRNNLYDLVWTKPAKTLATELGISDVMIAKICKKHRIPKPGLGYWSRLENGYKDPVIPLPSINDKRLEVIEFSPNSNKAKALELPSSISEFVSNEDLEEYKIVVPERIGKTPPLLAAAREKLAATTYLEHGLLGTYQAGLHLHVSRENLDRSIKILSSLVTAFTKRGFPFSIHEPTGYHKELKLPIVIIQGVEIKFRLQERLKRTKIDSLEQIKDKAFRKQLSYGFSPGKEFLIPSGNLFIQIDTYTTTFNKKVWEDSEKNPLELQLNNVLKGLIIASQAIKESNEEWAAERARRDLEQEIYEQEKAKERAKADRGKALLGLANDLNEYQKIVSLKQRVAEFSPAGFSKEIQELSRWIEEYCAEPDPLTEFLETTIRPRLTSQS